MTYGTAGTRLLPVIGLVAVTGPGWAQAPGAVDVRTPPAMSAPETRAPDDRRETEIDLGARDGGPASCQPRYSAEARPIGTATGDPEKDDYGFILVGMDCPAQP
ncbi:hypothetical protein CR162_08445 [Pseudoroseomonas rhizosphaerae]|uniref:Uncharacterized protein n=1 Tax=Teichococcus rhizosphaerae TaxID=1335062 RepID=A0A2C6Y3W9_9PROT|nr:hypothetical protein [Pseudoroseomonas rhizosphaerae]PHK95502.1 hypothetical protein CR162_08445 [Pseudoroseomonas rhizosphaerae]